MVCYRGGLRARSIHNGYVAARGSGDIDLIHADPDSPDHLELGCCTQNLARDVQWRLLEDQSNRIGHQSRQLVLSRTSRNGDRAHSLEVLARPHGELDLIEKEDLCSHAVVVRECINR